MKKQGIILIDNLVSLVLILVITTSTFIGIHVLKETFIKHKHITFKKDFMEFINIGKYRAVNDSSVFTLRFEKSRISLVNNKNKVVDRYNFPKGIEMININAVNNRTLTIHDNGLISRGATFTYSFYNTPNKITISAVTGKVNYA